MHLDIASYGDMSSFFWAHSQPPPPGLVECNVSYGEHLISLQAPCATRLIVWYQQQHSCGRRMNISKCMVRLDAK